MGIFSKRSSEQTAASYAKDLKRQGVSHDRAETEVIDLVAPCDREAIKKAVCDVYTDGCSHNYDNDPGPTTTGRT
ncbi:MAG: hypothetical protein LBV60_11775, partial [Streptomyces sp.]|nr:hypothetical protein [Streptomyces sp.]